eukprot:Skav202143  [mRNA]  locus=scaffold970:13386:16407:+ [translate_table: standard]
MSFDAKYRPLEDSQTIEFTVQHLTQMLQTASRDKKASRAAGQEGQLRSWQAFAPQWCSSTESWDDEDADEQMLQAKPDRSELAARSLFSEQDPGLLRAAKEACR